MPDLSTTYMGLKLRNPLIVASSGLTSSVERIVQAVEAGAGAVVVKSLFEEQILADTESAMSGSDLGMHSEAMDYLTHMGKDVHLNDYLSMVREARQKVDVPVIASLNCVTAGTWTDWARTLEKVGIDGLELNVFIMPADVEQSPRQIEATYLEIARKIRRQLSVPVAMKLGSHFSAPANMLKALAVEGIGAFVLFNRFYRPDVDINNLKLAAGGLVSSPLEMADSLRWIALLSGEIEADFAATTGVHDAAAAIKQLLVGARAVQLCSVLYKNGLEALRTMLEGIERWMDEHGYGAIEDFRGMLCQERSGQPEAYERAQYVKALVGRG